MLHLCDPWRLACVRACMQDMPRVDKKQVHGLQGMGLLDIMWVMAGG